MLQFFRVYTPATPIMPSTDWLVVVYQYSCRPLQGGPGSSRGCNDQGHSGEAHEGQGGDKGNKAIAVVTNPLGLKGVESQERMRKAFQLVDKIAHGVEFD